jgi:hypothetical protein
MGAVECETGGLADRAAEVISGCALGIILVLWGLIIRIYQTG